MDHVFSLLIATDTDFVKVNSLAILSSAASSESYTVQLKVGVNCTVPPLFGQTASVSNQQLPACVVDF